MSVKSSIELSRYRMVDIVAILISGKIELKPKSSQRDREGYNILIKEKNPPRGHCNYKHLSTKHQGSQVHKRNATAA